MPVPKPAPPAVTPLTWMIVVRSVVLFKLSQNSVASEEVVKDGDDASEKNMTMKITNAMPSSMAYAPMRRPITSVGRLYIAPKPAPGM